MPALYTITTRASGTILTAAIYNADHQNHVNNGDAQHLGGFSANTSQMRTQTSPGDVGSESLSLSISDELARIRYMIALQRGTTFWYGTSPTYNVGPGGPNFLRNSDFLNFSRTGQALKNITASAGDPYIADQWYVHNAANQIMTVGPSSAPMGGVRTLQAFYLQRAAGQTGVTQIWVGQPFTLAQIAPLQGMQVCYSFYAFLGPNWSATSVGSFIATGTGANAAKITGITGRVDIAPVSSTPSLGVVTRISGVGVIPANCTQMDFIISWFPVGTAGANDYIIIGGAKLEPGSQPTPYFAPDPYVELAELQAFYWKSFPLGVAPVQNVGNINGAVAMSQYLAAGAGQNGFMVRFPSRMIKSPAMTLFNPNATNAQARNASVPADCTLTSVFFIDESDFGVSFANAAGSAAGQANYIHATAEAGI